jgi:glycosyltransferase involved in cell wall biosynthesis
MDLVTHLSGPEIRVKGMCVGKKRGDHDLVGKASQSTYLYYGDDAVPVIQQADVLLWWGGCPPAMAKHANIYCSHGCGPWIQRKLKTLPLNDVHLTAVSQPAADILKQPNVTVIHNGSDARRLASKRDMRKRLRINDGTLVVGYVGRLTREKRAQAAIEGVATLNAQGTPATALLVGGRTIPGYKDTDDTIFVSRTEQLGDYYHAMDCFVLASPSEGFSLSMIEAWLCGVPVVATPVGAVPEIEEQYGQLVRRVPVGASPEQIADAIREAISPEFDEVIQRAKRTANEHFTVPAMAKRWTSYITSLV